MWRPVRDLLLRATYGTAFKVPSLYQRFSPRNQFSNFSPDPRRNNENATFLQYSGGNPDLKPELARSRTIGFILEPAALKGFSIGVNAFHIRQRNFIAVIGSAQTILANESLFGDRVVRAAPSADDTARGLPGRLVSVDISTLNFGEVKLSGADIQTSYALRTAGAGNFKWTLAGTYMDKYDVVLAPGAAPQSGLNRANFNGYPLRVQGNSQLAWDGFGGWFGSLTARYTGSYLDYFGDRKISAATFWDGQFGYRFGAEAAWGFDRTKAALGIINIANKQGPFSNYLLQGYDPNHGDLRGRFVYITFEKSF